MDYFDMLTEQRIDSETADLVDALLEQALPSLQPCDCPLETVLKQLADKYPLTVLPRESTHYAQTALAVIESDFPEDADYLPHGTTCSTIRKQDKKQRSAWHSAVCVMLRIIRRRRCPDSLPAHGTASLPDSARCRPQ